MYAIHAVRRVAVLCGAGAILLAGTTAYANDLQPTIAGCDLQGGCPAPAAATASPAASAAISWAQAQTGSTAWDGLCLRFVTEAYDAAGINIRPLGDNYSAVRYWNSYAGARYTDAAPPAGAVVFWDADSWNADGHVAISLGDGTAISSEERSTTGVHTFAIADRNATKPYLGYVIVG